MRGDALGARPGGKEVTRLVLEVDGGGGLVLEVDGRTHLRNRSGRGLDVGKMNPVPHSRIAYAVFLIRMWGSMVV